MNISIIVPSSRPKTLAHVLKDLEAQSIQGISYEIIIIQEAEDFKDFQFLSYSPRTRILRQKAHHDCGACARDLGLKESQGEYVAFWDDDNIYYPHAIATILSTTLNHDIGIVRIKHQDTIIPTHKIFKAGDIDSMCCCVKREIASKVKWADNGGRYNDFRWITKLASLTSSINHSPIIIGEHL